MPDTHAVLDKIQEGNFWFEARNRLFVDLVRRFANNATRVLEIGCGTGFVLRALHDALPGARLCGSEICASGLAYAWKRLEGRAEFLQMDARAIPFADEFDLIGAFDVLEHVEEDVFVLSEIHRAMRPGGISLLTVPQHQWLWSEIDAYSRHKRRYHSGELADKMRSAGFEILLSTSFVVTLLPAMFLSRRMQRGNGKFDPTREFFDTGMARPPIRGTASISRDLHYCTAFAFRSAERKLSSASDEGMAS
jgi:SAM-dependent methyltransferase